LYSSGSPFSRLAILIMTLPPRFKHEEHIELLSRRGDCSVMLEGCLWARRLDEEEYL